MLQRTILRSSRAIRSTPRLSSPSSTLPQSFSPLRPHRIQPLLSSRQRWYSEATAQQPRSDDTAAAETANQKGNEEKASSPEDKLKKDIEAKDREIIDLKDKYLRSVADFRNLQERTRREVQAAKDFALQRFAKDLIDSVDNLDHALSSVAAPANSAEEGVGKDLKTLYDGLKMTDAVVMQTLSKHGLERVDPVREKFDPNLHEATFMTPQADKEDGTVFHTQQKGWMLNGRVLRAAKVGVVKNS